jgi:hypothetical protein
LISILLLLLLLLEGAIYLLYHQSRVIGTTKLEVTIQSTMQPYRRVIPQKYNKMHYNLFRPKEEEPS